MKRNYIVAGLLFAFCILIPGCGNSAATENISTQQDELEKQDVAAQEDINTERDKYEELAKENFLLQGQIKSLSVECSYYETQAVGKSAEGFDKQNLMDEVLQSRQADVIWQDSEEEQQSDEKTAEEETFSIPEIDEADLESSVAQLEEENQELQLQIDELKKQLEAYKMQYMN